MLPHDLDGTDDGSLLERIKGVSGWCIEEQRKRAKITQDRLAKDVGVTVRWLREIEAGNPKASIEDHLRCAAALGLTTGYLLILIMFMERKMTFPRELLLDDLAQIEDRCVACIAEFSVASLARRLHFSSPATPGRLG
jgi:DNA-binding XRE family transcriptional regulator